MVNLHTERKVIVVNGYFNKNRKIIMFALSFLLFILSVVGYIILLLQPGYNIFCLIPLFLALVAGVCNLRQLKSSDIKLHRLFKCLIIVFFVIIIAISAVVQYFHICKTEIIIDEFEISEISEEQLIKIKNESDFYNYVYGFNISDMNFTFIENHKKDFVFVTASAHIENYHSYPVYNRNMVKCFGMSFPKLFYQQKLEYDNGWLMPGETMNVQFSFIIDRPIYKNDDEQFLEFVEQGIEILTFFVW